MDPDWYYGMWYYGRYGESLMYRNLWMKEAEPIAPNVDLSRRLRRCYAKHRRRRIVLVGRFDRQRLSW